MFKYKNNPQTLINCQSSDILPSTQPTERNKKMLRSSYQIQPNSRSSLNDDKIFADQLISINDSVSQSNLASKYKYLTSNFPVSIPMGRNTSQKDKLQKRLTANPSQAKFFQHKFEDIDVSQKTFFNQRKS